MKYNNVAPIYQQIMNDIKEKIIRGTLYANMQIPPVREFALLYEVNPNTMQRALAELEREGYVYTQRTAGRFVIDDAKKIETLKTQYIQTKIDEFLHDMRSFTSSDEALLQRIKERMCQDD